MEQKRRIGRYEWRGKDSVRLTVRSGTDPDTNEPIRHTRTVKVKPGDDREAERQLSLFIAEIEKGKYKKPTKMSLEKFADWWKRDYLPTLARTTQKNYLDKLDTFILPALGHKKMDKITTKNLMDLYSNLQEDGMRRDGKPGGMGPDSIQQVHKVLSSMFKCAEDWGEIPEYTSPTLRAKPPKVPPRKQISLDDAEAERCVQALSIESLKYRAIAATAILTGMRRGEILGLSDDTIDFKNFEFDIEFSSHHVSGEGIFLDDPKNRTSKRRIPFPPSLAPLLQAQIDARNKKREKCGDKWVNEVEVKGEMVPNKLLFTQWNGKPMHPNTLVKWFRNFREDNNFPPKLTLHKLRATNITLLLNVGEDIGAVSSNAGHAKKSTTVDMYYATVPKAQRAAAQKMDSMLGKNIPALLDGPLNYRRKKEKNNKDPEK